MALLGEAKLEVRGGGWGGGGGGRGCKGWVLWCWKYLYSCVVRLVVRLGVICYKGVSGGTVVLTLACIK